MTECADTPAPEDLGVVVIGRNEGERLVRCLGSVLPRAAVVVYVDSGSEDGSVAAARALGAETIELDLTRPFTAARARNTGWRHLLALHPGLQFVQFVDGDCELVPTWLMAGRERLLGEKELAAVAGRLRERAPDASLYNRLCDMEWNVRPGPAMAVGGIALFRREALEAADGFDARLICGEEPELCHRLRRDGWRFERLAGDMALHDAAMFRLAQWWQRTKRGGYAYAQGAALHGAEGYRRRALRSIAIWTLVLPLAFFAGSAALSALLGAPIWLAGVLAVPGTVLLWLLASLVNGGRIARRRVREHGDAWPHARRYGVMTLFAKWPEACGVLAFRRHQRRGTQAALIEYK